MKTYIWDEIINLLSSEDIIVEADDIKVEVFDLGEDSFKIKWEDDGLLYEYKFSEEMNEEVSVTKACNYIGLVAEDGSKFMFVFYKKISLV